MNPSTDVRLVEIVKAVGLNAEVEEDSSPGGLYTLSIYHPVGQHVLSLSVNNNALGAAVEQIVRANLAALAAIGVA